MLGKGGEKYLFLIKNHNNGKIIFIHNTIEEKKNIKNINQLMLD
jgi:hypothetical protein